MVLDKNTKGKVYPEEKQGGELGAQQEEEEASVESPLSDVGGSQDRVLPGSQGRWRSRKALKGECCRGSPRSMKNGPF